uniref:Putative secreted protein n=1 Tax=Ixodes ricinus TaxID=34613 RepID=V5HC56_IXORI
MAGQILTVFCIISAAILLPEVHSRAHQTNYDAAAEILIPKRYSMKYRSLLDDRTIREARYCVSLLFTSAQFGVVEAVLRLQVRLFRVNT